MARPPEIKLLSSVGVLVGLGALVETLGLSYPGPPVVLGRGALEDDLATDDVHEVVELGLADVTGALVDEAVVTGALVEEAVVVQDVEVETFLDEEVVTGALVLEAGGAR